jgi:hypothetical protein
MTANTWVARLTPLTKHDRETIFEYLESMDQAGPVPTVKWLKERVMEHDLRAAKKAQHEQT